MIDSRTWLANLLANGPMDRREIQMTATQVGVTQKQLRCAREALRLVVSRRGNRRSMRSTWCLPAYSCPAGPAMGAGPVPDAVRRETPFEGALAGAGAPGPESVATMVVATQVSTLTEVEAHRVERRVTFFVTHRGLHESDARGLAIRLIDRDRAVPVSREGACPECQLFIGARASGCPTPERRNSSAVWMCWSSRRDSP